MVEPRYDPRLDDHDLMVRMQAELEALRTALIASNSDSCDEYHRLRTEIKSLEKSYDAQVRNTLAFKAERDRAYQALRTLDEMLWNNQPEHTEKMRTIIAEGLT